MKLTHHRLRWYAVLVALAFVASCDRADATECDPACENGLVCNTDDGRCVSPRHQRVDGELSGRSVRMAMADGRAFLASIDATARKVLVGTADQGEPTMYALADITRPLSRKLAVAATPSTVAVAWLEQDRKYRLAIHRIGDEANRWRVLPPVDAGSEYRGSEHFDVTIDISGRLHLAFHDAQSRALAVLSGPVDDINWSLATVDDPDEQSEITSCSDQRRRLSGQGLGYYPDILASAGATFVAYHDKDCGDLRLASRIDGLWSVTVVDTGDYEVEDDPSLILGVTGKFPAVAVDGEGNVAIAYQDHTRAQLLLAYDQDGQFVTEVADPGFEVDEFGRKRKHLVGGFASLAFDDDGIPWIAYMDATTARLQLAHRRAELDLNGTWAQETIDARPPTGFSTSIGFSPTQGLMIATERLRPRAGRLESRLDLLRTEEF